MKYFKLLLIWIFTVGMISCSVDTSDDSKKVEEKIVNVTSVKIVASQDKIIEGDEFLLSAEVEPEDATDKRIIWTSSSPSILGVDSTGKASAKKTGTVTVTAKAADGSNISGTFLITVLESPLKVKNFFAENNKTGSIKLTWNANSIAESYDIEVYRNNQELVDLKKSNLSADVTSCVFENLVCGDNYGFKLISHKENSVASTGTIFKTPKVQIWEIASGFESSGNVNSVTRFLSLGMGTEDKTSYNISALSHETESQASYWIVRPALSGDENYFSLEAASSKTGTGTGYYLYVDYAREYVPYVGSWGDGQGSPYLMAATLDGSENKGTSFISSPESASFKWAGSTYGAGWKKLICQKDESFVQHAYLTYSAIEKNAEEDINGCGAFVVSEETFANYYSLIDLSSSVKVSATQSSFDLINSQSERYVPFNAGSKIIIASSGMKSVYGFKEASETGNYTFAKADSNLFSLVENEKYFAVSPQSAVQNWNGSVFSGRISANQNNELNKTQGAYLTAKASVTNNELNLNFEPFASVIEIDLSQLGVAAESVFVKSLSGVNIAGDFKFNPLTYNLSVDSNGGTSIYSSSQSDVVTVYGIESETSVRVYVLPVKLKGGIAVTVKDVDGNFYTKYFKSDVGNDLSKISVSGIIENGKYKTAAELSLAQAFAAKPYSYKISFGSVNDSDISKNLWQATIPGNTWFTMLSTPGAHDSATSGCSGATASYSKCQMLSLQELLDSGVRGFDLRPGYMYSSEPTIDSLKIYHGSSDTGVLYKDAIKILVDFLIKNPTEAITIIQIKENSKPLLGSSTDYSSAMWNIISNVLNSYRSYIIDCDHSDFKLEDVRGKILYLQRNGTDCPPMLMLQGWPDNASSINYSAKTSGGRMAFAIEDCYDQGDTTKKLDAVKEVLYLASSNTNSKNYHFAYTSIAANKQISTYVGTMNWNASQFILNELNGPTGYVYGDYMGYSEKSGAVLVNAIINQNYKYIYSGR